MANQGGKGGAAREEFNESSSKGPSSQTDESGLEGSILEGEGGKRTSAGQKSTGAGAEAAEGMHANEGRNQHDKSALTQKDTGRSGTGDEERIASEPMDRTREHKGSYGGEGGAPRTSSDQRESSGEGGRK